MKLRTLTLSLAMLVTGASFASAAQDAAHGYWLTQNGKAIVLMSACGTQTCGQMVWTATPRDQTGKLKLDLNNSDDDKRSRPICGLQLVGGMKRDGVGKWQDGWIYNPRNGETYSAEMRTVSADQLKVRGYLGISLLGQSQIWTRVSDDRGGC